MKKHAFPGQETDSIVFLSFRLDRRAGCLTDAGKAIPLRPKTWAVLLYLAERPGALVTREELLDAVWPEVAVTPDTLTKSIGELRVALGDDSKAPRCIETVHRRGFRFIADTRPAGPAAAVTSSRGEDEPNSGEVRPQADVFVGREEELAMLSACFEKACMAERQTVLITGPAGQGKTALVEAFLDSLASSSGESPVWIGRGSCVEQHGTREAYMPVLDAVGRLAHRPDADAIIGLLRRVAPTWLVQMPWLLGDDAQTVHQSLQSARPERMLREFAALIEALGKDLTVVLVLEDLHWSDAATVDLLSVLAQRHEPARLLVLGTYRAAEAIVQNQPLAQAVRTLRMRRQCNHLPLHELSREEVERYLEARFPSSDFASALAAVLHEYTDGNPLVVVAVVENMLSRGWILETEPGWALSTPVQKLKLEMPDDARRMIEMQFDSLTPTDRRLLQVASVIGKEFAVQPVAAALGCSVEDAESRCDALSRTHSFLRFAGTSHWPGGAAAQRYVFAHELYRHAAYDEIPEGQRRRLHQEIGENIEAAYGEGEQDVAAELAEHFEQARDYARAVVYLTAAAERAQRRFAKREAIGSLDTALQLAALLPDRRERLSCELDVRLALGPALSDFYGYASERVRTNYERARNVCAEVGEPKQLFEILYALSHVYAIRSDEFLIPKVTAELDELATRLGSRPHRLLTDTILVRTALEAGRLVEACRLAEQRLPSPVEAPELSFSFGPDPLIDARCNYAYAMWLRGYAQQAREIVQANLAAAERTGSVAALVPAFWFTALLEAWDRNPTAARAPADRAMALSTEYGFEYWHTLAMAVRGWISVQSGQTREGIEELERARAAHFASDSKLCTTYILAFLAEGHLRAGTLDAGSGAIDEGLSVAESTLDRSIWPELWRIKGELLLASTQRRRSRSSPSRRDADSRAAERCFLQAVQKAREREAKLLELRAANGLARLWQSHGKVQEACSLLSELCRWFGPSAEIADLRQARALLAELTTTRTSPASPRHQARRSSRQLLRR